MGCGSLRALHCWTRTHENVAQLSVSDRGSGIPEDKLEKVFAPFFTGKAEEWAWDVHRAHHYRGAPWADIGKKSRSWRRDV